MDLIPTDGPGRRRLLRAALVARLVRVGEDSSDRGATATEYAILVSFIALVVVFAIAFFGSNLSVYFTQIGNSVGGFL